MDQKELLALFKDIIEKSIKIKEERRKLRDELIVKGKYEGTKMQIESYNCGNINHGYFEETMEEKLIRMILYLANRIKALEEEEQNPFNAFSKNEDPLDHPIPGIRDSIELEELRNFYPVKKVCIKRVFWAINC